MAWTGADAEGIARSIFDRAHADAAAPLSPRTIAARLGIGIFTAPRRGDWGDASLGKLHGKPTIWLCPKLEPARQRFAIAHELAEWAIGDGDEDDAEGLANAVAASVLVPPPVLCRLLRVHGYDLPALARALLVTESCAVLRVGEVVRRSLALVSPALVRVRGDDFGWPDEGEIRRVARAREVPPELERVRLVDDARRVVLLAA